MRLLHVAAIGAVQRSPRNTLAKASTVADYCIGYTKAEALSPRRLNELPGISIPGNSFRRPPYTTTGVLTYFICENYIVFCPSLSTIRLKRNVFLETRNQVLERRSGLHALMRHGPQIFFYHA